MLSFTLHYGGCLLNNIWRPAAENAVKLCPKNAALEVNRSYDHPEIAYVSGVGYSFTHHPCLAHESIMRLIPARLTPRVQSAYYGVCFCSTLIRVAHARLVSMSV